MCSSVNQRYRAVPNLISSALHPPSLSPSSHNIHLMSCLFFKSLSPLPQFNPPLEFSHSPHALPLNFSHYLALAVLFPHQSTSRSLSRNSISAFFSPLLFYPLSPSPSPFSPLSLRLSLSIRGPGCYLGTPKHMLHDLSAASYI